MRRCIGVYFAKDISAIVIFHSRSPARALRSRAPPSARRVANLHPDSRRARRRAVWGVTLSMRGQTDSVKP